MRELEPPMARALDLAWESFRAGSLGIGAVVTRDGAIVATGRNRMAEADPGDDLLAGTSVAHAEINALAKLRWRDTGPGLELWTTLQPCVQCLGAIRLSAVGRVHVLAPDPLFRGVERMRGVNAFVGKRWPEVVEQPVDRWAVLGLLFFTHVIACLGLPLEGWNEALPSLAELAANLLASGELQALAEAAVPLAAVADALGDRLDACIADVERVAALD